MSDSARIRRAQSLFGFLILLGLAVIVWGLVGPAAGGAVFSEVVIDELELPKQPETYSKVAVLFAEQDERKGIAGVILGLMILVPAGIGYFAMNKAERND